MSKISKWFITSFVLLAALPLTSLAQKENTDTIITIEKKVAPNDWHQLDRAETGYFGISLDKALEFLKGRKSEQVIVAVIDSGVDTLHEAVKPILWKNPGEIPGNGSDDDKNG